MFALPGGLPLLVLLMLVVLALVLLVLFLLLVLSMWCVWYTRIVVMRRRRLPQETLFCFCFCAYFRPTC